MKRQILITLLISCFTQTFASATIWKVPSRDLRTIQDGIDAASDGDEVVVLAGTYTGDGNRDIDFGGRAITVRSTNPNDPDIVAATIIDCNGTEAEPHRGFYFHNNEESNSVLAGFTITNGYASAASPEDRGGAIRCYESSPKIANCVIIGNSARIGGGIACEYHSSPIITNCAFIGNLAGAAGGAMDNYRFSNPTVTKCLFVNNRAVYDGGAITNVYISHPTLTNCIIAGNSAGNNGGGISNIDASGSVLTNCIISGNWAGDTGGGLYYAGGPITNCTITGNRAKYCGGLAYCCASVSNCIIWGNSGEQIDPATTPCMSVTYTNVQGSWSGLGNIDVDPYFVDPGYWDANGTPNDVNDDFWVDGDYHLQSAAGRWNPNSKSWVTDANTSVCIDAGNPGCPPGSEPLPNGSRINMGAYGGTPTASKTPADWRSIADLTNDWIVDFNDLAIFVDYWLDNGQCIPSDLNHNRSVDFNDFAIFSQQWPDTPAVGPGITYQIDDCNLETELGLAVVSQSGELRFSVTVEGSFIHFEDVMAANCCPDELGLEMTVVDSLITIYETEYTPGGCWCICDYPVAATLGPFEPGIYILEVYEDWGGFIGSTIVIIE